MKLVVFVVAGVLGALGSLGSAHAEAPSAFRVNSVELMDPHVFAGALFFCFDGTDQLSDEMVSELNQDEEKDGLLDASLVLLFRPLAQAALETAMEVHVAECTAPASTSVCSEGSTIVPTSAVHLPDADTCLAAKPAVLGPFGAPTEPAQPCFASPKEAISVTIAGVKIELDAARVAATYTGTPATKLSKGLLVGFLREDIAEKTFIPDDKPLVGGESLASLFRGGKGNCESGDDRDIGPDGKKGWWLHFNFTAKKVSWEESTL